VAAPVPVSVRVHMEQIGFGDCFLLSFVYDTALEDGRQQRHMLLDFGSKAGGGSMSAVATRVAAQTDGRLDAIVVTHRHQDHLSGFGSAAAAQVLNGLKPKLIVRPWTEDPAAPADAQGVAPSRPLGPASRRLAARLRDMQEFAAEVARAAGDGAGARGALGELAVGELSNKDAIRQLDAWAATGEPAYVRYGDALPVEQLFPGVTMRVIGPPTVEQHPGVRGEGPEDLNWLWQSPLLSAGGAGGGPFRPEAPAAVRARAQRRTKGEIGPVRWLVEQMQGQQVGSVERIVRVMDGVLNNTSVILLIQVGDRRLLFPGDAEHMNWEYALNLAPDREALREELRQVDLYKVGHHGSRNATPKELVALWSEGAAAQRPRAALVSTRVGVFPVGETPRTKPLTAVPRIALVNRLVDVATLYSTGELAAEFGYDQRYVHVPHGVTLEAKTRGGEPFKPVL
jgi:hypothetical protein